MNLRHLRAALAVESCGGISAAAERVHLSQSAVSQGIRVLESEIGDTLFRTSSTGTRTTPAGARFLRRVGRAFKHIDAMEDLVRRTGHRDVNLSSRCTYGQLLALIEVVEQRSYTQAAKRLGITQPSIYRSIKQFEESCGMRLFSRSPSGADPSWMSRRLARHASLLVAELEQGRDELVAPGATNRGRLRVGALPLARASIVPDALVRVLKAYPESRLSVTEGPYEEQLHRLLSGQLDVIVGALRYPKPAPELVQELLFSNPLRIVTRRGHALETSEATSIEELQQLVWIAPRPGTPARIAFTRYFESAGLEPPGRIIECSSLVAARGLLMQTDCAALLPALQVATDVAAGLLAISPQQLPGTSRDIGLAFHRDWEPTELQSFFLDSLKQLARRERDLI
jgi:DNA-binding transcriptional LysR family regulator